MQADPFSILGVGEDADAREIAAAYRRLAMRWHPDRNPGDPRAAVRFRRARRAYEILRDPRARGFFESARRARADSVFVDTPARRAPAPWLAIAVVAVGALAWAAIPNALGLLGFAFALAFARRLSPPPQTRLQARFFAACRGLSTALFFACGGWILLRLLDANLALCGQAQWCRTLAGQ